MVKYICSGKIDVNKIVETLFDFTQLGAMSIPGILNESAREDLLKGIHFSLHLFTTAERKTKKSGVIQEMQTFYLERVIELEIPPELRHPINQLTYEYAEI